MSKARTFTRYRVLEVVKEQKTRLETTKEYINFLNGNAPAEELIRLKERMEVYRQLCERFEISPDELAATAQ